MAVGCGYGSALSGTVGNFQKGIISDFPLDIALNCIRNAFWNDHPLQLTACCSDLTATWLLEMAALMGLLLLLLDGNLPNRPREAINFCINPR